MLEENQSAKPRNNTGLMVIIAIIIIVPIAIAALALSRGKDQSAVEPAPSANMQDQTATAADGQQNIAVPSDLPSSSPTPTDTTKTSEQVKTFTVTGANFSFAPNTITVNKGDTVKIIFKNAEGNHDWVIDAFNAQTNRIGAGQTAEIEFTADKTGSFEYYCSVGKHRAMGMKGTLTVK